MRFGLFGGAQAAAAHAHHPAVAPHAAGEPHPPRARRAHRRARPREDVDPAVLPGGVAVGADGEGARHLPAQRPAPRGVRDVRHMWDDEITIGREEGDVVYSDDAFLSRRHCTIGWDGNRAVITDLGSSNGTFVRLGGTTTVKNGEHVRMGDQLFRIELRR